MEIFCRHITLEQYSFNNNYPSAASELSDQTAIFITTGAQQSFLPGDMNEDGILNILDIVALVSIIMGNTQTDTSYEIWASDFNIDGIVNVLDVYFNLCCT